MTGALSESDDLIALSGLQHFLFCERQAALIHVERAWREDGATAEGRVLHERADLPGAENRRGVRVERAVMLRSVRLGLYGRADVVEYHLDADLTSNSAGSWVAERKGSGGGARWRPFPVEYKRGREKDSLADRVQLCAQALCLEEMHGVAVPSGALFYGGSHRRIAVGFDAELRHVTEEAARRLHELVREGRVPRAVPAPKCRRCSLAPICLPDATAPGERSRTYLARLARPEDPE